MKTLQKYIFGFTASLILTGAAFVLVEIHLNHGHEFPSHEIAVPILVALALLQLVVQLVLFLHVADEGKPRLNLWTLFFALIVVVILVGGTLWIMNNLSHGQHDTQQNIFEEENISPQSYAR